MTEKLYCPTCGCPVNVGSSDEGTNYYIPDSSPMDKLVGFLEVEKEFLQSIAIPEGLTERSIRIAQINQILAKAKELHAERR